jgi:hypothetical protein
MKTINLVIGVVFPAALLLAACAPAPAADACASTDAYVEALRAGGAEVEVAEQFSQEFFSVPVQRLVVNGSDVQAYEYADSATAAEESERITGAGYIIGNAILEWIDTPHWYQCGNLIVLHIGDDQGNLDLFTSLLGEQLAAG